MLGVFAEYETNLRKERQLEGIAQAKEKGVYAGKGRPATIDAQLAIASEAVERTRAMIGRSQDALADMRDVIKAAEDLLRMLQPQEILGDPRER